MRKPTAVAIVVAGAIAAFPSSASASVPTTGPPQCERGQLTAFFNNGKIQNLVKFLQCATGEPPRGLKP